MTHNAYKVEAVGRVPETREAYVRYVGVPGRHVVNPESMTQHVQDAFHKLVDNMMGQVEELTHDGYDFYEACCIVASKRNEIKL